MQENTGLGSNNQKPSLSWSQPAGAASAPKAAPASAPSGKVSAVAQDTSYTGTYIGIFAGGLIVGALIGWAIAGSHGGVASPTASSTVTGAAATTTTGTDTQVNLTGSSVGSAGSFTVVSPQTAGFAVAVGNVKVTEPTWVVVYEDHAGVPGNALGAALFLPQSGNNVQSGTVQLLRGTLPGQNYLAGEALDDGDKIFSLSGDKPVRDTQGNPILVQFSTQ